MPHYHLFYLSREDARAIDSAVFQAPDDEAAVALIAEGEFPLPLELGRDTIGSGGSSTPAQTARPRSRSLPRRRATCRSREHQAGAASISTESPNGRVKMTSPCSHSTSIR